MRAKRRTLHIAMLLLREQSTLLRGGLLSHAASANPVRWQSGGLQLLSAWKKIKDRSEKSGPIRLCRSQTSIIKSSSYIVQYCIDKQLIDCILCPYASNPYDHNTFHLHPIPFHPIPLHPNPYHLILCIHCIPSFHCICWLAGIRVRQKSACWFKYRLLLLLLIVL